MCGRSSGCHEEGLSVGLQEVLANSSMSKEGKAGCVQPEELLTKARDVAK